MDLLGKNPRALWYDRKFGVLALVAMGREDEALRYAEASRPVGGSHLGMPALCEEILLASDRTEDAYRTYAFEANWSTSYLGTFRALAKKYPHKKPAELLADLVARTPGEEGKWFAAAKDVGLYSEAIVLARSSPCDPRTLTRAARDYSSANPAFALEAGMAALHWIVQGHGYEITGGDVLAAYAATMRAAENAGTRDEMRARIRALIATSAHQHGAGHSSSAGADPVVRFHAHFEAPGVYKAWGQFQRAGKVLTAPFVVEVGDSGTNEGGMHKH